MVVSNTFLQGDALSMLKTLPDECVQMVCTSPPYYGLRAYLPDGHPDKPLEIGLEETPAMYVAKLVEVFREVRRVLRRDGTVWCNLGDSYVGGNYRGGGADNASKKQVSNTGTLDFMATKPLIPDGYKPKNLYGIPWRVAFALQEDGWILRADCIWHKTNAMPESVKDRPTKAHEYVFLLSKNERYFYDHTAILEPFNPNANISYEHKGGAKYGPMGGTHGGPSSTLGTVGRLTDRAGRNKRSVWSIPTQSFPGSHFAVMAPKLAETCILAGTSPQACEHCGAPWQRVIERGELVKCGHGASKKAVDGHVNSPIAGGSDRLFATGMSYEHHTVGWQPTCTCTQEGTGRCIVLDPFSGAGTTAYVAMQHGRKYIGVELNPEYILMAEKRLDSIRGLWEAIV